MSITIILDGWMNGLTSGYWLDIVQWPQPVLRPTKNAYFAIDLKTTQLGIKVMCGKN